MVMVRGAARDSLMQALTAISEVQRDCAEAGADALRECRRRSLHLRIRRRGARRPCSASFRTGSPARDSAIGGSGAHRR
jgi:hypothetical protein